MKTEVKEIENRIGNGKLNFAVVGSGNIFGQRKTATSCSELLETMGQELKKTWEIIEFRGDDGRRIVVTREFMREGMTLSEVLLDWDENATQEEFEEPIKCFVGWGKMVEF